MRLPPRGKSRGGLLAVEGLLVCLLSWELQKKRLQRLSTPRLKHIDVDDDNLLRFYRFRRAHSHIVCPLWCVVLLQSLLIS
jgi:hypothetical protein